MSQGVILGDITNSLANFMKTFSSITTKYINQLASFSLIMSFVLQSFSDVYCDFTPTLRPIESIIMAKLKGESLEYDVIFLGSRVTDTAKVSMVFIAILAWSQDLFLGVHIRFRSLLSAIICRKALKNHCLESFRDLVSINRRILGKLLLQIYEEFC